MRSKVIKKNKRIHLSKSRPSLILREGEHEYGEYQIIEIVYPARAWSVDVEWYVLSKGKFRRLCPDWQQQCVWFVDNYRSYSQRLADDGDATFLGYL